MTVNYPPEVLWIKQNKGILNLKAVSEAIGIPAKALWNYCNSIHNLNETWWKPAEKYVQSIINGNSAPKKAQSKPVATKKKVVGKSAAKKRQPVIAPEQVVELKAGDQKAWAKAFKEAGVKAIPSGSRRKPYMSDAIKKKLGR